MERVEDYWNNRPRREQPINYLALTRDGCTPSDIDGCFEWKDKAYIFYEVKYKDAPTSKGQLLMYLRLWRDVARLGKQSLFAIIEHSETNPDNDIRADKCIVREYYLNGKKFKGNGRNAKEITDTFLDLVEGTHGRETNVCQNDNR